MTSEEAFLQSIIQNPDDDAVRLIYADFLEEQGPSPRAEFIRLQILLHQCPLRDNNRDIGYREWERLKAREGELLLSQPLLPGTLCCAQVVHRAILRYAASASMKHALDAAFRRGFVETVACPLVVWMEHGPAIARQHPLRPDGVRIVDRLPQRVRVPVLCAPRALVASWRTENEPAPHEDDDGRYDWEEAWAWLGDRDFVVPNISSSVHASLLPAPILACLEKKRLPSEQAARDALSRACLQWARQHEPGRTA